MKPLKSCILMAAWSLLFFSAISSSSSLLTAADALQFLSNKKSHHPSPLRLVPSQSAHAPDNNPDQHAEHVVAQVPAAVSPFLVLRSSLSSSSRRGFLQDAIAKTATATALVVLSPLILARVARASDDVVAATTTTTTKKILSDEELKAIILSDIVDRQFLVTGRLTLSAYEPTAQWQDEIDTYEIKKWVTGTEKLFVGEQSSVRLVGDVVVTPERAEFRFDEDLMFRLPLGLRPVVHLTGRVVLDRNPATGLVAFGREIWDQDVSTVLKSAKF